jgi:hypothetical protein
MEQSDYLERQIEAMGAVIRGLLHWLATGKLPNATNELVEVWQQRLAIDLPFLDPDQVATLVDEPAWDEQNLQALVHCYITLANRSDQEVASLALRCAKNILNELEDRAETYQFDRAHLLERVELQLIEYGLR